jgi:hypothetical protein
MKPKSTANGKKPPPAALKALRRAAKKAVELGRLTRTPAYVLKNGQIVDAAKQARNAPKTHERPAER